jgi:hypothetical protein
MCVAYESAFKDHEQRQSETERPLHLPMQGPFPVTTRAHFTAAKSLPFAPVPPQALPKFNPR